MLVRSSSGEHTFYKVKDANNVVLTGSLGNEPKGETAKLYVLKKKISAYRSCKLNRLVVQIHKVCKNSSILKHHSVLMSLFFFKVAQKIKRK